MEDFLLDIPAQIATKEPLFGLDMHPSRNLVAFSSAAGTIQIHEYNSTEANNSLITLTHHTKSCRSVIFSPTDGRSIFSCSSDKSIVGIDLETKKTVFDQKKAHKSPINTMFMHDQLIFTGDEDGVIKIWDQRKPEKVKEISENEDFISALLVNEDRNTLLATSGDQTLTVIDFGSGKMMDRSEQQDDELMSLALIKDGKKVVCGGSTGLLSVFTWDKWADRSSVCPGHFESVDCMVPVDENTIITGCDDGIIRIVSILPNKILGVISAQGEEIGISNLCLSHDRKYLTACVDTSVHFWNVSILFDDDGEPEEGIEEEDQVVEEDGEDGFIDEEEGETSYDLTPTSESESGSDSASDSEEQDKKTVALQKTLNKKKHFDADKAAFFEDL